MSFLNERFLRRVPALTNTQVRLQGEKPTVEITWPTRSGSGEGYIAVELDNQNFPMEVTSRVELSPYGKNSAIEGTAAVLTLLACVNQAALTLNRTMMHIVYATEYSTRIFKKLVENNIYSEISEESKPLDSADMDMYKALVPYGPSFSRKLTKYQIPQARSWFLALKPELTIIDRLRIKLNI